jgi:hypothetical protein
VETSLRLQLFVYTIQTLPIVGRVDLAAVFFDTARWRQENLFFSKRVCKSAIFSHAFGLQNAFRASFLRRFAARVLFIHRRLCIELYQSL